MGSPERFAALRPGRVSYEQARDKEQKEILAEFKPEERRVIRERQQLLSSLAYFIGKDFSMPVLLNQPGGGWHWNFEKNETRIDPKDLLEKPLDYLRFVISHEAGHRRISRAGPDIIPAEEWQEPGFSFLMNAIEDPRDNNFVAEAYPKFKDQMNVAYAIDADFESKSVASAKGKLGRNPRFLQAGMEYIKQWLHEANGEPFTFDPTLPEEVREVLEETLPSAQDSWWLYPTKEEADTSEETIREYAKASYKINRNRIWPAYKKLVDEDIVDQRSVEMLKDIKKHMEGEEDIPEGLKDKLTPEELGELIRAFKESGEPKPDPEAEPKEGEVEESPAEPAGESKDAKPVDFDSLSPELKKKLAEHQKTLSEEQQKMLDDLAREILKIFEEELNKFLEAKLAEAKEGEDGGDPKEVTSSSEDEGEPSEPDEPHEPDLEEMQDLKDAVADLESQYKNEYERAMQEELPIIKDLEDDLREIFVERHTHGWETGHKFGKKIDIKKRIQEKAKSVSAFDSRAWQKREAPTEKDYAFTLLVDLSGSMRYENITETFKAVVVLTEVLSALSIKTEVVGFNDQLHPFLDFDAPLTDEVREKMGSMLQEVHSPRARYNDDGWALKEVSERLAKQDENIKILMVLSDGKPEPSREHSGLEFNIEKIIAEISSETNQKLIGLGIGSGTDHVSWYYPKSLANIPVREMAEKLADMLREVIAEEGGV